MHQWQNKSYKGFLQTQGELGNRYDKLHQKDSGWTYPALQLFPSCWCPISSWSLLNPALFGNALLLYACMSNCSSGYICRVSPVINSKVCMLLVQVACFQLDANIGKLTSQLLTDGSGKTRDETEAVDFIDIIDALSPGTTVYRVTQPDDVFELVCTSVLLRQSYIALSPSLENLQVLDIPQLKSRRRCRKCTQGQLQPVGRQCWLSLTRLANSWVYECATVHVISRIYRAGRAKPCSIFKSKFGLVFRPCLGD